MFQDTTVSFLDADGVEQVGQIHFDQVHAILRFPRFGSSELVTLEVPLGFMTKLFTVMAREQLQSVFRAVISKFDEVTAQSGKVIEQFAKFQLEKNLRLATELKKRDE